MAAPSPSSSPSAGCGNEPMPAHQQSMIEACESGNLSELQRLFEAYNVKTGDPPIYHNVPSSGPPGTLLMIVPAVANMHHALVTHLLSTYPKVSVWCQMVVEAFMRNPNLEMLKLLHAHDPRIIDFEWNPWRTFSTEACEYSENWLLEYLVDAGACQYAGGFAGAGPIVDAIKTSRPLELVKKMFDKGASPGIGVVDAAIRHHRPDVLRYIFTNNKLANQVDYHVREPEIELKLAIELGNKEVIELLEDYIEKRKQRTTERLQRVKMAQEEKAEGSDKALHDNEKQLENSETRTKDELQSAIGRKWWQAWKFGSETKPSGKESLDGKFLESKKSLEGDSLR